MRSFRSCSFLMSTFASTMTPPFRASGPAPEAPCRPPDRAGGRLGNWHRADLELGARCPGNSDLERSIAQVGLDLLDRGPTRQRDHAPERTTQRLVVKPPPLSVEP